MGLDEHVRDFIGKYINSGYNGSILLNGKWGTGKTSYLNLIQESVNKNNKKERDFIWLDFWDESNSDDFYKYIYLKLMPKRYRLYSLMPFIIIIIIGLIQTLTMYLKATTLIQNIWVFVSVGFYLVLTGLFTYWKDKLSMTQMLRQRICKYLAKNNNVIFIIDDFDRIDEGQRNELYSKLSTINSFENSLIIVVGDYSKIADEQNIFIQKILNEITSIPYETNPNFIWEVLESRLNNIIRQDNIKQRDTLLINDVKDKFIEDQRTYREAKQLFNIFKHEYVEKRNCKVNVGEMIYLCYIYIFYNKEYKYISNNIKDVYEWNLESHNNINPSLVDFFEKNWLTQQYSDIRFIYNLFHQKHDGLFKFRSIKEQMHFPLYQIERIENYSSIDSELVYEYFEKTFSESRDIINKLNEKELKSFAMMIKDSLVLDIKSDAKVYIELLKKLAYPYFFIEKEKRMLSLPWQESLLRNVRDLLDFNFKIKPYQQYEEYIIPLEWIDVSQKLELLTLFVPLRDEDSKIKQSELFVKTIQNNHFKSVFDLNVPIYIYMLYTGHYNNVKSHINIDEKLEEIFELDNSEFYQFVINKLAGSTTKFTENHTITTKYLNLSNIAYNKIFEDKFSERLSELNDKKREEIENIMKSEWEI